MNFMYPSTCTRNISHRRAPH